MRNGLIIAILGLGIVACRSREAILPLNDMKAIVWDMMKADEWFNLKNAKDSTFRKRKENFRLYEQVFLIHGITKEKFYKSYEYYVSHPSQMKILTDSVDAFSTRENQRSYENKYGKKK